MTSEEALNNIAIYSSMHNGVLDDSVKVIANSLKAFDVVKYRLDVVNYGIVWNESEPSYWLVYNNLLLEKLTEEEYYLLKEVLRND